MSTPLTFWEDYVSMLKRASSLWIKQQYSSLGFLLYSSSRAFKFSINWVKLSRISRLPIANTKRSRPSLKMSSYYSDSITDAD